jgi:hypothetical protein
MLRDLRPRLVRVFALEDIEKQECRRVSPAGEPPWGAELEDSRLSDEVTPRQGPLVYKDAQLIWLFPESTAPAFFQVDLNRNTIIVEHCVESTSAMLIIRH